LIAHDNISARNFNLGEIIMANIQSEIVQMNINGVSAEGYLSKLGNLDSKAPGIVVIQEWWGLDDHIKSITERFAEQGFIALAPDLFHGSVTTEPDEAMKLTQAMDQARAREEIDACVAYIQNSEDSSGKVGVVGYCLGGGLSIQSACENSNISACNIYYGGNPDLNSVQNLKAPVLGIYAENDERITSTVPELEKALNDNGIVNEIIIYPNVDHAFFNDTNIPVYNKEAAESAWSKTLSFFSANLR
tara:strand:+ start:72 stop:812 length:741 start_codon:yes stop_codon:yes gene_type:complete